jgi:hypothetical protein
MTYHRSRWSVLALFPALALTCTTDPGSLIADESDTGELVQFRENLLTSKFEIETDANLELNGDFPALDWASVTEIKKADAPTGQGDNSFAGGAKEDIDCSPVEFGSIPKQKSDLKEFRVYVEEGANGHPGYLHLAWARVQDPKGATLMDFELNQSSENCEGTDIKQRTPGDVLIEYALAEGPDATVVITVREWEGSNWSGPVDLTQTNQATGSINTSFIDKNLSDGLGDLVARTFGEASIDLTAILDPDKCTSFGSAYVKSRSSVPFTSAPKDYISPESISITNCGQVNITKETIPVDLGGPFTFTHTVNTEAEIGNSFPLDAGGSKSFADVIFGDGYTVTEDATASDVVLDDIVCCDGELNPCNGVEYSIDVGSRQLTFNINEKSDVLSCTFINRRLGSAIKIIKTRSHAAAGPGLEHPHQGVTFNVFDEEDNLVGSGITDVNGEICIDGLEQGDYTVREVVPDGYEADFEEAVETLDSEAKCSDDPFVGKVVEFHNKPLTDITMSVVSQIPGGTASTITCEPVATEPHPFPTDSDGYATFDLTNLLPGTYKCTVEIE